MLTLASYVLPKIKHYRPSIIFVACGFDALAGDPYADMRLSAPWFGWLAARLREEAIAPLVFNLEGACVCVCVSILYAMGICVDV